MSVNDKAPEKAPEKAAAPKPAPTAAEKKAADKAAAEKAARAAAHAKAAAAVVPSTDTKLPDGYKVRWVHKAFDLAKKEDKAVEGAPWLVICNLHGSIHDAANASQGDSLGSLKGRQGWCQGCKADAAKAAKADKK